MTLIDPQEIKLIGKTALPLMAAFLAQKGMQLVDTLMMGRIGPQALAAGALSTSFFMMYLVICMGTLSAAGVFIARARGANNNHEVSTNLQTGIYLAILVSIPCMSGIWYASSILFAMGINHVVVVNTLLLLHGLVWGFPGFLLFFVLREFISAFALTKVVLIVCAVSIPLTFIANYGLIYGVYGLPALGIAGIGYAGAGIMWFMFFCLYFYCLKHPLLKNHVRSIAWFTIDIPILIQMISLGIPTGLIFLLDSAMFSVAAIMMGHFGLYALAAQQIAMQCVSIAYSMPFALSMATALLVGHAAGAHNMVQARRYAHVGIFVGVFIAAVIALLFITMPREIAGLFLSTADPHFKMIIPYAVSFLSVAALFQCFDALQAIVNGALKGLHDTFIPMLLCLTCYWLLGIGSAYYLAFHTSLHSAGIWYGLTLGITSASIILLLRFLKYEPKPVLASKELIST